MSGGARWDTERFFLFRDVGDHVALAAPAETLRSAVKRKGG